VYKLQKNYISLKPRDTERADLPPLTQIGNFVLLLSQGMTVSQSGVVSSSLLAWWDSLPFLRYLTVIQAIITCFNRRCIGLGFDVGESYTFWNVERVPVLIYSFPQYHTIDRQEDCFEPALCVSISKTSESS
jgi:hypothetical protein